MSADRLMRLYFISLPRMFQISPSHLRNYLINKSGVHLNDASVSITLIVLDTARFTINQPSEIHTIKSKND